MAANLARAGGLPLAERVTALLREPLGGPVAHDLVAGAAARSAASGVPLRDVLLATPQFVTGLAAAGIAQAQVEKALDPAGYLGAAQAFIAAALDAHAQG
jgi:3-carboxy-cis,cis-muconate cycloisomerase